MKLEKLINSILDKFHTKHRKDFDILIPLAQKVESVHGDHPQCPVGLSQFLEDLRLELENHMLKEEQILFPMIKRGQGGSASGPISVMLYEHEEHEKNLIKLKRLAKNYILPEESCSSWRALYQGVETLEYEIREHIEVENNELFPQVLNAQVSGSCCGGCS